MFRHRGVALCRQLDANGRPWMEGGVGDLGLMAVTDHFLM